MRKITRRNFLGLVGTVAVTGAITACSSSTSTTTDSTTTTTTTTTTTDAADENVEIRVSWWGSDARHELTLEAIAKFEEMNPGITVVAEYSAYDGYQEKLVSQLAAGNAPDVFTCVTEWYSAIYEADGFYPLDGMLDVSGHSEGILDACSYNGTLYGVCSAISYYGIMYNKTLVVDELGMTIPDGKYTYDDLFALCAEAYEKSGGTVYGITDMRVDLTGWWAENYGMTALQHEAPYMWDTEQVYMTGEDFAAFIGAVNDLPEGSMQPPAETAGIDQWTSATLVQRTTAFAPMSFGTYSSVQAQTDQDVMGLMPYPYGPNGEYGALDRPALIQNIFSGSEHPEAAAKFLDFFTNSDEAALILTSCRGVLPTVSQRAAVADILTETDLVVSEACDLVASLGAVPFYSGPLGADAFKETTLVTIGSSVAFGDLALEDVAAEFDNQLALALM